MKSILLFLGISVLTGISWAKDPGMVLITPEGHEIVLNSNNTWEFKNGQPPVVEDDFTVPLDDGRIIFIGENRSWGFVEEELREEGFDIKATKIVGSGYGKHLNYDQAEAMARQKVLNKTAQNMKVALSSRKVVFETLQDCVRRVEKDEELSHTFKEGLGWEVKINWSLDRGSILAVAHCASPPQSK